MQVSRKELYHWCDNHFAEHLSLLRELASIPAPSHHEHLRAEYIRQWLEKTGAEMDDESLKALIEKLGNEKK